MSRLNAATMDCDVYKKNIRPHGTSWQTYISESSAFVTPRKPGANANPYVPIILPAGHSEKKRVVSARDAGITEFLAKPISATAPSGRDGSRPLTAAIASVRI